MDTIRFTVQIPQDLATWLDEQAKLSQRSRNKQLVYILRLLKEQQAQIPDMRDERWLDGLKNLQEYDRVG